MQSINRRSFLQYCTALGVTLGLGSGFGPKIAEALTSDNRPPVIWLHFSECTGCSESFLRSQAPDVATILLDILNVTYHETIQVAAGEKADTLLLSAAEEHKGNYICVVEGSIPTADGGVYGKIGGRTMLEIAQSIIPNALATICFGTCSAYGGLAAAAPNPTGAKGVKDAIGVDTINITGCPPHPDNLVALIANYLLQGQMPALRADGRPEFCHGETIHSSCTTPHGCLEGYNCKGPKTYANCHKLLYNQESWCMQAEHQCIGCAEPDFWDANAPFYNPMWSSMFATFRSDAADRVFKSTVSCSPCHSDSIKNSEDYMSDPRKFQRKMHDEHDIRLGTNQGCASCHKDAPGATAGGFDDDDDHEDDD